jgi:hypothetical protein
MVGVVGRENCHKGVRVDNFDLCVTISACLNIFMSSLNLGAEGCASVATMERFTNLLQLEMSDEGPNYPSWEPLVLAKQYQASLAGLPAKLEEEGHALEHWELFNWMIDAVMQDFYLRVSKFCTARYPMPQVLNMQRGKYMKRYAGLVHNYAWQALFEHFRNNVMQTAVDQTPESPSLSVIAEDPEAWRLYFAVQLNLGLVSEQLELF